MLSDVEEEKVQATPEEEKTATQEELKLDPYEFVVNEDQVFRRHCIGDVFSSEFEV